jgi:hypothetical protein
MSGAPGAGTGTGTALDHEQLGKLIPIFLANHHQLMERCQSMQNALHQQDQLLQQMQALWASQPSATAPLLLHASHTAHSQPSFHYAPMQAVAAAPTASFSPSAASPPPHHQPSAPTTVPTGRQHCELVLRSNYELDSALLNQYRFLLDRWLQHFNSPQQAGGSAPPGGPVIRCWVNDVQVQQSMSSRGAHGQAHEVRDEDRSRCVGVISLIVCNLTSRTDGEEIAPLLSANAAFLQRRFPQCANSRDRLAVFALFEKFSIVSQANPEPITYADVSRQLAGYHTIWSSSADGIQQPVNQAAFSALQHDIRQALSRMAASGS